MSCAALLSELNSAVSSASALVFLAQTVKDYGAIEASAELYERALNSADAQKNIPQLPNMTLNLAHTQEICYRYSDAFKTLFAYLLRFASTKSVTGTGRDSTPPLKLESIVAAVKGVASDLASPLLRSGEAPNVARYQAMPEIFDAGHIQVQLPTEEDVKKPTPKARNPYSDEELNILALCFTAVKILYIAGALQPIPALVHLLGTRHSHRLKHQTSHLL